MMDLVLPASPPGVDNPYWEKVRPFVEPEESMFSQGVVVGLTIGGLFPVGWRDHRDRDERMERSMSAFTLRESSVKEFSWTVTDPPSVEFVARHSGGKILDPLAGTGYWTYLLRQYGVDCISTDVQPPSPDDARNFYHPYSKPWVEIEELDGRISAARYGRDRTLLLFWPPYADTASSEILEAYWGRRVIFCGEGEGGATGDDEMWRILEREYTLVAEHRPVQFYGLHDHISVWDRRPFELTAVPHSGETAPKAIAAVEGEEGTR